MLGGGHIGTQYEYIDVLDFEKKIYLEFSRENNNDVQEFSAYWFDENRVVIPTSRTELSQDFYIYDILDEDV